MNVQVFCDYVFGVGLIVQVTKLLDWLLRPSQQEWLTDLCETITLRLDALHPWGGLAPH
jgi:hypothetical protein